MSEPTIGGIVLAAGAGRRFGGPKQVAELGGLPLLEHAVMAMEAVPAIAPIAVVLGAHAEVVRERVDFGSADPVVCDGWEEGQAASLRCGLDAVGDVDAVLVTLGDQPGITPQVIAMVMDAIDSPALAARATYDGVPGHPVLLKRALFPLVRELRGDVGARPVLEQVKVKHLEAARLCSNADVDTPEQLEAMAR